MAPLKNNKISQKSDSFWRKNLEKDFELFPNIFSQIFFDFFDQKWLVLHSFSKLYKKNLSKWKIWVSRTSKKGFSFFVALVLITRKLWYLRITFNEPPSSWGYAIPLLETVIPALGFFCMVLGNQIILGLPTISSVYFMTYIMLNSHQTLQECTKLLIIARLYGVDICKIMTFYLIINLNFAPIWCRIRSISLEDIDFANESLRDLFSLKFSTNYTFSCKMMSYFCNFPLSFSCPSCPFWSNFIRHVDFIIFAYHVSNLLKLYILRGN